MNGPQYSLRIRIPGRTLVTAHDFAFAEGKITFLFGESGIGKSLIMRALYGLLDPSDFEITINGEEYATYRDHEEVRRMRERGYFVFQEPSTHLNPLQTLREQIKEGNISTSTGEMGALDGLWQDRGEPQSGLLDIYPTPHRPSGGEKARILSIGAFKKIAQWTSTSGTDRPPLFVFDEPTGNLDNGTRDLFLTYLFEQYIRRHFTCVVITHDYSMITFIGRMFSSLQNSMEYRELRSSLGTVTSQTFDPQSYRHWLNLAQHSKHADVTSGEPLLQVHGPIRIHGRTLKTGKNPLCSPPNDLVVRAGSLVYLKAPSGEGKTTFVKAIMGLARAEELSMTCHGRSFTESTPRTVFHKEVWGKKVTMVFQHADEALNGRATVRQVFDGLPTKKAMTDDSVKESMELLFSHGEIPSLLGKRVETLSGGQKQRVNLLRSLVLGTSLVILDEPLTGLDFETLRKVLRVLQHKRLAGTGFLLISHNEEIFDAAVDPEDVYYLRASI